MTRRVAFDALIKRVEIKSLVSGDKGLTITLQVDSPEPDKLNDLNGLHRADRNVFVVIAEKAE